MILKDTYELPPSPRRLGSGVYRDDPIKDRLNDRMLADALRDVGRVSGRALSGRRMRGGGPCDPALPVRPSGRGP